MHTHTHTDAQMLDEPSSILSVLLATLVSVTLLSLLYPIFFSLLHVFLSFCLFTPPLLSAVFAVSFGARHPEAAVAPASLPTSVFVVEDDMLKLWREGEGRERGRDWGREGGRVHITQCGGKSSNPERECHAPCSPSRSSSSANLVFACLCGQAWLARRSNSPPLFFLSSSFHSLAPHVLPPPFSYSLSYFSLLCPFCFFLRSSEFPKLHFLFLSAPPSVCCTHRLVRAS